MGRILAALLLALAVFCQEAGAASLSPGVYRAQGAGDGLADIVIKPDGAGSFEIEEESNPFNWRARGNELFISMLDQSLPPEHREMKAVIKGGDAFELDGIAYERDRTVKVLTYEYAEKGFSGSLTLFDWTAGGGGVNIVIATVNESTTSTCDVDAACKAKGALWLCGDAESGGQDAILTLKGAGSGALEVESSAGAGEFCGRGGDFAGKYRLAQ